MPYSHNANKKNKMKKRRKKKCCNCCYTKRTGNNANDKYNTDMAIQDGMETDGQLLLCYFCCLNAQDGGYDNGPDPDCMDCFPDCNDDFCAGCAMGGGCNDVGNCGDGCKGCGDAFRDCNCDLGGCDCTIF